MDKLLNHFFIFSLVSSCLCYSMGQFHDAVEKYTKTLDISHINKLLPSSSDINTPFTDGNTLLHILIKELFDYSQSNPKDDLSLLMPAFDFVLQQGADIMAKNKEGQLPYNMVLCQSLYALQKVTKLNIFCYELSKKMLASETFWQEKLPIKFNRCRVIAPCVRLLETHHIPQKMRKKFLFSGTSPEVDCYDALVCDEQGKNPLHWAAENCCVYCLKRLLENGYRKVINVPDNDGNTPLVTACFNNKCILKQLDVSSCPINTKIAASRILLQYGAQGVDVSRCQEPLLQNLIKSWYDYNEKKMLMLTFFMCIKRLETHNDAFALPLEVKQHIWGFGGLQKPDLI